MTPEEMRIARREVARMNDDQLAQLEARGPDHSPPDVWEVLEEEINRRQRSRGHNGGPSTTEGTAIRLAMRFAAGIAAAFFVLVGTFFGWLYLSMAGFWGAHLVVILVAAASMAIAALFAFVAAVGRAPRWVHPPKR